ncbi:MAG: hypothetical protein NTX22_03690 [Ignavibacteriales bacterium]|nr:hypothetical protein [Ignavibacteriales bacterium]
MIKFEQSDIPTPILLNCWKHHIGFIQKQIKNIHKGSEKSLEKVLFYLRTIGESQMDLYLGELTPNEISRKIIDEMKKLKITSREEYKNLFLTDGIDYKLIEISDGSSWTLRFGNNANRYIHIHPSRNSIHTVRVRATTLKTAILVLCWRKIFGGSYNDVNIVNQIREDYLSESPIKNISFEKGLGKLFLILNG